MVSVVVILTVSNNIVNNRKTTKLMYLCKIFANVVSRLTGFTYCN